MEVLKERKHEIINKYIYKMRGGKVPPIWAEDKDTTRLAEYIVEGAIAKYESRMEGKEVSRKSNGKSREKYLEDWEEFHEEYWQEFMKIEDLKYLKKLSYLPKHTYGTTFILEK